MCLIFFVIFFVGVFVYFRNRPPHEKPMGHVHSGETQYQCSMHPEIVQENPGKCPICAMDLQPVVNAGGKEPGKGEILFYRHPMQPDVTSSTPKKDEMGMDYIPVYSEVKEREMTQVVKGRALTGLSLNQQQLIGIKTDLVSIRHLTKTINTYGRVAYDPALYNAQEEFLAAVEIQGSTTKAPFNQSRERSQKLLESARLRLKLLGMSDAQVKDLEDTRQVDTRLLLTPTGADKVWIYADIYENDLSVVKAGQKAEVTTSAFPGQTFRGRIVAIDPVLDPKTRTVRARIEVRDPQSKLKPELFVNVLIQARMGRKLSVPESAVMDSGLYKIVFVDKGQGNFEPREVVVGRKAEGYYEVLKGLEDGEKVVSNGNFLLDAESQLRGATAGMTFYKGKEAAE